MEKTADQDEFRRLVAGLRVCLEARARDGVLGIPSAPSPRFGVPVKVAVLSNAQETLRSVREEMGDCQRCRLCAGRQNIVFGTGNPEAKLVFVGEGPGADEDRQGEPFVGAAGQLLTKMIEAMGFSRADVYICNVVKCRPPQNRDPQPDEVAACEPFLKRQLLAMKPEVIVALGRFAAQALCGETTPIGRLRGNFRSYEGIKVMPTFHPSYLLRNEGDRQLRGLVWQDLKEVVAALQAVGIEPPRLLRT